MTARKSIRFISDRSQAIIVTSSRFLLDWLTKVTDGRYHKRSNFVTVQMADYEIRDVMNRQKHPMLSVDPN